MNELEPRQLGETGMHFVEVVISSPQTSDVMPQVCDTVWRLWAVTGLPVNLLKKNIQVGHGL
jgi:hypothetical protein